MPNDAQPFRFTVKAVPTDKISGQLDRSMAQHPLNYQELPFDPEYFVYNRRLASGSLNNATAEEVYWMVRRTAVFRHTAELPLEIVGADAETFLNRVFTRDIRRTRVGRCSYQFACFHDGGLITDGVLMRLAADRFWYVQADGDLFSWLRAAADGMNVKISNPNIWVSQVQGPCALDILAAAADRGLPERFKYFDIAEVEIASQPVKITRSGFTNELGWEVYLEATSDARAIGEKILSAGRFCGLVPTGAVAFRTRRIEAGLLSAGTDFDNSVTPFAMGVGHFVDFDKEDFIGKAALQAADKRRIAWGLKVDAGIAQLGVTLSLEGSPAGLVCSSAWSPFQQCGVALVRLYDPDLGPGARLEVVTTDGEVRSATVCDTPMYDQAREIPRGTLVDIPDIPDAKR
jgi:glycine cleavage system aminomethyltransferase T